MLLPYWTVIPFVAILLAIALGYDSLVGVCLSFVAAGVGFAAGFLKAVLPLLEDEETAPLCVGLLESHWAEMPPALAGDRPLLKRFIDVLGKLAAFPGVEKCRREAARLLAKLAVNFPDVALPAARTALERAGRRPEDVDLIILGTDSPDYITPSTSVVLQHKLGARNAGTFDVGCACASFPTGLGAAAGYVATNAAINTVLNDRMDLHLARLHASVNWARGPATACTSASAASGDSVDLPVAAARMAAASWSAVTFFIR